MTRLIDADELNEYIGRESLDTREKIFALVDRMPTLPNPCGKPCAFERPHGEWITVKREFDGVKGKFMAEYCACSNCGWDNEHWQTQWVACPKCGADMREGEEK